MVSMTRPDRACRSADPGFQPPGDTTRLEPTELNSPGCGKMPGRFTSWMDQLPAADTTLIDVGPVSQAGIPFAFLGVDLGPRLR